jgi:GNAT superfamily N-acetyltransferase
MPARRRSEEGIEFHPLTADRWQDFERLFGPRGACAGCWCMWWRLARADWVRGQGEENRRAMRKLVREGKAPGILAYAGGKPVGWCALGPRAEYSTLARSKTLGPVDDRPVWSITCFFVDRTQRRRGLTANLIRAALAHARAQGAHLVEAYPVEPVKAQVPALFAYTGFASTFRRLGFVEVARRSATRPILRRRVRAPAAAKTRRAAR